MAVLSLVDEKVWFAQQCVEDNMHMCEKHIHHYYY